MTLKNIPLEEFFPFINWNYFFAAWSLRGRFPAIFNHPEKGRAAKELYEDAQQLLSNIMSEKLLQTHAVAQIFPVCAEEDDIILYTDESRSSILKRLPQLRNQEAQQNKPNLCLADFIMPTTHPQTDYAGLFTLSSGFGLNELTKLFKKTQNDYKAIMAKALADRLAEACAIWLQRKIYHEYALLTGNNPNTVSGIRPAVGYPCCPDHSMKKDIFEVLQVEREIGMQLTESYMMLPETSICGYLFFRPQARYFSVGKIDAEQLDDYAARRGMSIDELKRLMPNNVEK